MKYDKRAAIAGLAGLAAAGCASGHMVITDKDGAFHYFTPAKNSATKEMLLHKHGYVSAYKVKQVLSENKKQLCKKVGEVASLEARLTSTMQEADVAQRSLVALRNNSYSPLEVLGIGGAVAVGAAVLALLARKYVKHIRR